MSTMSSLARRAAPLAFLLLAASAGGCGLQDLVLGKQGQYFLNSYDSLALPGEEVAVTMRLFGGNPLHDIKNVPVVFSTDGRDFGLATTDSEGYATVLFTPTTPGDYLFTARVAEGAVSNPPPPIEILVACRPSDTPILIVDLDKTLVASGFRQVLVGQPQPMPRSQAVMEDLAKDFTIIYLTHRLDYLGPKTRAWLCQEQYPRGPVLLATAREVMKQNRVYKTHAVGCLRERFSGRAVGVGDKISDAQAYAACEVEPILLVTVNPKADAWDLRRLADSLRSIPVKTQVVTDWDEVAAAIAGCAAYAPAQLQVTLRKRADDLGRANHQ
jgi:hypothetical protein